MIESPQGLLLLDKPAGVTSFDCVAVVRRAIGVQRVGHCGTLDPNARGLLLILVGAATRCQESFLGLEKQYWFRGELGRKTTTADLEGETIEQKSFDHVTQQNMGEIVSGFVGESRQTPPRYAALKYKGKPYYHYARKGVEIPRVPRPITISSFSLLSFRLPYWDGRVICSRGTYIRTLVEDVADRLNTCATLVDLVRERVGTYRREDALSWMDLRTIVPKRLVGLLRDVSGAGAVAHA